MGAEIDRGDAEIERVEERRGAEDGNAEDPERDGGVRRNEKRCRQAEERDNRSPERKEVQRGEGHFACTDLQRKEIVSEAGLGRRGKHQKNHQRTVERGERGKTIRRVAKAGEEREMHARPDQMDAHEQRHGHAQENAEQRQPKIVQPNRLVVSAENAARQKAAPRRFLVICPAMVDGHACSDETPDPPKNAPRE